jgi:ribosomal protein S18 acetylase RimI-like enzyme
MNLDHLTIETDPEPQDVKYLEDQINHFNVVTTGITDDRLLSLFPRDEHNEIIAGIFGWTWGGTCEVRSLWVQESWRGQGLGKKLLLTVEDKAIKRGCHQVVLDTHSFQSPDFYQKLGYEIIGRHDHYPLNHQKYYLRKMLR